MASGALLFGDKGFSGVSIREICADAQTSVGMVHHHFGNKRGLFDAIVALFSADVFAVPMVLLSKMSTSPEDFSTRIEMLFESTLDAYISQRAVFRVIVREQVLLPGLDAYVARLVSFLDDAKEKGFVREELDSAMVGGWMLDRICNQVQFAPFIDRVTGSTVIDDPEYKSRWCVANLDLLLHGVTDRG